MKNIENLSPAAKRILEALEAIPAEEQEAAAAVIVAGIAIGMGIQGVRADG